MSTAATSTSLEQPGTSSEQPVTSSDWTGENGRRWAARADHYDALLAPVAELLLQAAAPATGARVIDVGCGCGATTLLAAQLVGPSGSVTGVDISEPMLEVARRRADLLDRRGASSAVAFVVGDAQSYPFERGAADVVLSRFGTMFFTDATAAFRNIAMALRPGGRLCIVTWQPLIANEWLVVPGAALLAHAGPLPSTPDEPGMFAQSDPDVVTAILEASGFVDVAIEGVDVEINCGHSVDEAAAVLEESGPGRRMLETIPPGAQRDAARAGVRAALTARLDPVNGIRLGGAIWVVSATRSAETTW